MAVIKAGHYAPCVQVRMVAHHRDRLLDEREPRHRAVEHDVPLLVDRRDQHALRVARGIFVHELTDPRVTSEPARQHAENNVLVFDRVSFDHHGAGTHLQEGPDAEFQGPDRRFHKKKEAVPLTVDRGQRSRPPAVRATARLPWLEGVGVVCW